MQYFIKKISIVFLLFIFINSYAITFSDPNKPIVITAKSPIFTINLASNRTTGYSWTLKKYNKYFKVIKHQYIKPQQVMPGAGGYEEWVIRVKPLAFKKVSSGKIVFVYARPWEKTPAKKAVFNISLVK